MFPNFPSAKCLCFVIKTRSYEIKIGKNYDVPYGGQRRSFKLMTEVKMSKWELLILRRISDEISGLSETSYTLHITSFLFAQ